MIRNVVFDYGNVMISFSRKYMVEQYITDPDDSALLQRVVFDRLYWDRLDAGTITDEEVIEAVLERLPERLHAAAREIYANWYYNNPPIEGMPELVRELRERGYHVYLLSNISKTFAAHAHEMEALRDFEKCIFSAVCGKVKPHADIFAHLCAACDILPAETVFIDDNKGNIDGAREFGITAYLFDGDVKKLRCYLDGIL